MTTTAVRVRAHAKINLSLRVLDRRPDDGYHDLRTVFQSLALHDVLTFTPRPGPFSIHANDERLPLDADNLVWRAADLLWRHLGRPGPLAGVAVQIEKRIPIKGGLGGGSADAAATILALARLWEADLGASTPAALGRQIGADVPFFYTGGAALGLGRGDEIYPLPDLPSSPVLLVVPSFAVSTAEAYRWLDEEREKAGQAAQIGPDCDASRQSRAALPGSRVQRIPDCSWAPPTCEAANDFEPVVALRHPELRAVLETLEQSGARFAAMTGSGSTVFALADEARLPELASAVGSLGEPIATRTLPRRDYLRSATPRPA